MPQKSNLSLISVLIFVVFVIAAIILLSIQLLRGVNFGTNSATNNREQTSISIAWAPELDEILSPMSKEFNKAFENGDNPVSGQKLENNDKKIVVTGTSISSGVARTQIVAALGNSSGASIKPAVYIPSVSFWPDLVNLESGKQVFDITATSSIAQSPVGIAIWESRLRSIQDRSPGQPIGYSEINKISRATGGWKSYNSQFPRSQVFAGTTNPQVSSTAVSALINQYYAGAEESGQALEKLTSSDVSNSSFEQGVKNFQNQIRHYSENTVVFRDYLSRGPDYIDMLPLAENDLIFVNQGRGESRPAEKLVMLYPKEGSVVHNYPYSIPQNVDWINEDQRIAAKTFQDYILQGGNQKRLMDKGLRPANKNIQLVSPITTDLGVDPAQPAKVLAIPEAATINLIQTNWEFVKKPAMITLLVDTSGSMSGAKIESAKKALRAFASGISAKNQISLVTFDSEVRTQVTFGSLEDNRGNILRSVDELRASGSTALNEALTTSIDQIVASDASSTDSNQSIQAIVLLSDGEDTKGNFSLRSVVDKIEKTTAGGTNLVILPIAYGSDADQNSLNTIARSSKTTLQIADEKNLDKLLATISSYF